MPLPVDCRLFVVGPESIPNMLLAHTLKAVVGSNKVSRYLELSDMYQHAAESKERSIVIFFDLLEYDLAEATTYIGKIRKEHPVCVFVLYLDKQEFTQRKHELPPAWIDRLELYFRLYKVSDDAAFEPVVRHIIQMAINEANNNLKDEWQYSKGFEAGMIGSSAHPSQFVFVSYARENWHDFVEGFTTKLQSSNVNLWVDQHLLFGGDDWMDSIGEALDKCKILTLIISPDALESRWVKMEYRYFLNNDKTIIPILYKPVQKLPFELAALQYFDFSKPPTDSMYGQLVTTLRKYMTQP